MDIVQVGLGNFGKRHLEAWRRLGFGERLWIVEPDEAKWPEARRAEIPERRILRSLDAALERAPLVDLVTPTDSHDALCRQALDAGKDVFVEKPMTMTSAQARALAALAEGRGRLIQVGYYYRFHPAARRLKADVEAGRLGRLRYLSGTFCGFKRARNDVGVMHTDGIHFLDLFNWLLGRPPVEVDAVCRDHFGRGLEDFSIALLTYPDGAVGKVESGYIQPGRWEDRVVAGAMTTKELVAVGEAATAEIDFEAGSYRLTEVRHEPVNGVWTPRFGQRAEESAGVVDPAQMIGWELEAFLSCVANRQPTAAGPVECGVALAAVMEALYESATCRERVAVDLDSLVRG